MDVMKTMSVPLKDVYQLLIGELRYGYKRNNHLMPDAGYEKVKRIIPEMYKVDKEYAIYTLKQLCEECISDQIMMNFHDGEDDEYGNRADAIHFVKYSLKWIHKHEADKQYEDNAWFPYNYDLFLDNVAKDKEPRYNVYEIKGDDKVLLTEHPVSQKKYKDIIFSNMTEGTFKLESHKLSDEYYDRRRSYVYHILSPVEKYFYVEHI